MSSLTRMWLACLAVVAAMVVVVPILNSVSRPVERYPEQDADERTAFDSDAALMTALEGSFALARASAGGDSLQRTLPVRVRERGARGPARGAPVTLEGFVAGALLRGIYFGESTRAAVLNDELVQEGDQLAPGLCVAEIGERHVLLELGGEQARLDLALAAPESSTREPRR